jgi:nicotinamidase-related amidase
MKRALVIIDVQEGIFAGHQAASDWPERLGTINQLISTARKHALPVIFVQHQAAQGHRLHPSQPGFMLHSALNREAVDCVVVKTECDSFFQTDLSSVLEQAGVTELIICGCWSNYCIDTTCRQALSRGYSVQLASDAHACANSENLQANQIIEYHNEILHGLSAGQALLHVKPAAEIRWA